MSIADIKCTPLRRAVLLVAFPAIMVWHEPRVLIMPFVVGWRCVRAAWREALVELDYNLSEEGTLLLRRGFAWMWHAEYHTDRDAALADVTARVR